MTHQTKVGLAAMALSLSTGALGLLLLQRAHAMPPPVEPERRALTGTVVDIRHDRRQQEYESTRDFLVTMGWMLIGCGAFGVLLGAGITFWVDRSDEQQPA